MTFADIKTKIAAKAGSEYVAAYTTRAGELFIEAVNDLIVSGQYTLDEVFGLVIEKEKDFTASDSAITYFSWDITEAGSDTTDFWTAGEGVSNISSVNDVYYDPSESYELMATIKSISDIKNMGYSKNLLPTGDEAFFYRVGKYIKGIVGIVSDVTTTASRTVTFILITPPSSYETADNVELELSLPFIFKAINVAYVALMKEINNEVS